MNCYVYGEIFSIVFVIALLVTVFCYFSVVHVRVYFIDGPEVNRINDARSCGKVEDVCCSKAKETLFSMAKR